MPSTSHPCLETFAVESPVGFWQVHLTDEKVVTVDYIGIALPAEPGNAESKLAMRVECMLKRYFKGEVIDFSRIPIQLPQPSGRNAISLTAQVMQLLSQIPYGETHSYQWAAEQLGKPRAARAIGGALGRNPIPIIVPCHRIIAKHGRLGGFMQGFAQGGNIKSFLLALEGHRFEGTNFFSAQEKAKPM